jgi:hypothetical protein
LSLDTNASVLGLSERGRGAVPPAIPYSKMPPRPAYDCMIVWVEVGVVVAVAAMVAVAV